MTSIRSGRVPTGLGAATAELTERVGEDERVLSGLPTPSVRNDRQRKLAASVLDRIRLARRTFLDQHVERLYDELTEGKNRALRLSELLVAAEWCFPGVVPSAALMSAENERMQAEKEGWEIDQGIFFQAVLRCSAAGSHLQRSMLGVTDAARGLLTQFRETDRIDLGTVLLERRGRAGHLTVNNRHCLNAEDNRLVADLETAVDLVALHGEIRVGVLRGGVMTHPKYVGKRVFSAGLNLRELHAGRISFVDFLLGREMGCVSKILHGVLDDMSADWFRTPICLPWIAVVDGFAIGGGTQLLTVMDRVIAADDAYLSLPATREGIVPGLANLRLGRFGGGRLTRQLVLGGCRLQATDDDAKLLIDEVVAPREMNDSVTRAVTELATPAAAANRRMIAHAEEPLDVLRTYLAEFALTQALRLHDGDVLHQVGRFDASGREQ